MTNKADSFSFIQEFLVGNDWKENENESAPIQPFSPRFDAKDMV